MVDGGARAGRRRRPEPPQVDDPLRRPLPGRLLIRSTDQAPVLAGLETTQALSPEGLDATYAFSAPVAAPGRPRLTFECDPALRPYDVDAPGLDRWDVAPPGPKGGPARLTVRLLAPLEEGTVRIRCVGPLGAPRTARAPSPGAAPASACSSPSTAARRWCSASTPTCA